MENQKQELMKSTKEELVEMIIKLQTSKGGRKGEVLACIKQGGYSMDALASELNINNKNVSSVLSGLRQDGEVFITYKIAKETLIDFVGTRQTDGTIHNDKGEVVNERGIVQ